MAVKIRLKRLGKLRTPHYRIVVADSRTKRDGRVIEEIGRYIPTENPSLIEVNHDRAQYWLGVGAQPTEQVAAILKLTGDFQKSKGDASAKNTVQQKSAKPVFEKDSKKKPVLLPKEEVSSKKSSAPAESSEPEAASAPEEAVEVTSEASASVTEVSPEVEVTEAPAESAPAAEEPVAETSPETPESTEA